MCLAPVTLDDFGHKQLNTIHIKTYYEQDLRFGIEPERMVRHHSVRSFGKIPVANLQSKEYLLIEGSLE